MTPDDIIAHIQASMHRPLTDDEQRRARKWAMGEGRVLMLRDYCFDAKDRERMSR